MKQKLTLGWLYPDLMSIYGDRGNIICLQKRCELRGINLEVKNITLELNEKDFKTVDLLFAGGAQDTQQTIVSEDLSKKKKILQELIEKGIPGLYICGAYQFLGNYYKEADGTIIDGLGVFDLYTENPGENTKRLIGNMVFQVDFNKEKSEIRNPKSETNPNDQNTNDTNKHVIARKSTPPDGGWRTTKQSRDIKEDGSTDPYGIASPVSKLVRNDVIMVGFENHGGRTYLGKNVEPLGKVLAGFGNNGKDKTEGAIYKNSIGSYSHGPILPKNPQLADWLISKALEMKYKQRIELAPISDILAVKARSVILKRLKLV